MPVTRSGRSSVPTWRLRAASFEAAKRRNAYWAERRINANALDLGTNDATRYVSRQAEGRLWSTAAALLSEGPRRTGDAVERLLCQLRSTMSEALACIALQLCAFYTSLFLVCSMLRLDFPPSAIVVMLTASAELASVVWIEVDSTSRRGMWRPPLARSCVQLSLACLWNVPFRVSYVAEDWEYCGAYALGFSCYIFAPAMFFASAAVCAVAFYACLILTLLFVNYCDPTLGLSR